MSKYPSNLYANGTRINHENVQLIWLDTSPCPNSVQCKLIELNRATQFCTDVKQCTTLLKSIQDEKIILLVSISLARAVLTQVHSYPLLISVFIVCVTQNEPESMELTNNFNKIVQVDSDHEILIKSIRQTVDIVEKQIFSFSIFNQNKDYTNDLSTSSTSFLWYQIVVDILKQMPDNDLICQRIFETYTQQYQNIITQFKSSYIQATSVQFFTENSATHKLINTALRTKDINLIYLFRHFIINLYDQIKATKELFDNKETLRLYYGQQLLNTELDQLKRYVGHQVSPNGFFCASFDMNSCVELAKDKLLSRAYESVLFQVEINPLLKDIAFVEISDKQQLLFNIDTVLKINSIQFDTSLDLWRINLVNDDNNCNNIQKYLQSVKKYTHENSLLIFFGQLFLELDQLKQSEIYFDIMVNSLPSDHEDIASIYNQIGNFLADKGQSKLALDNYQRAYEIRQNRLPSNHPHIAISLNNIGLIYKDQGHLDEALDYCQKALIIDEINYPNDHVLKAMTIENIGGIYKEKYLFSIAQTYFLRALNMYKSALPPNHRFLTDMLNSLGKVYCDQGYYDRALTCYQKALAISEINYTSDHLQKAQTIENIGLLYKTNGMLQKALEELLKALEMYKRIYSHEHPDIARCYGHIGLVYEASNDLDFALDYFNRQLKMDEKCLSEDHQNILIDIQWIIDIHKKKEESPKALDFCQKKYQDKKALLGENHPVTLAIFMTMIDLCNDSVVKSNYYKQALSLYENLSPPNTYAIIRCLDTMVNFYYKTNAIQEALNYQIKMVDLERQLLADDHIDLAFSLQRLGQLYQTLSNNSEADKCFAESKTILENYEKNNGNTESSQTNSSAIANSLNDEDESNLAQSRICVLL